MTFYSFSLFFLFLWFVFPRRRCLGAAAPPSLFSPLLLLSFQRSERPHRATADLTQPTRDTPPRPTHTPHTQHGSEAHCQGQEKRGARNDDERPGNSRPDHATDDEDTPHSTPHERRCRLQNHLHALVWSMLILSRFSRVALSCLRSAAADPIRSHLAAAPSSPARRVSSPPPIIDPSLTPHNRRHMHAASSLRW